MKNHFVVAALLGGVAVVSTANPLTYSITAHIISNGSSVHSTSSCYQLDAIIAEPVVGDSSSTTYVLSAGFSHLTPPISDTIFANGFEDCSP